MHDETRSTLCFKSLRIHDQRNYQSNEEGVNNSNELGKGRETHP
jgi:hypothetical protein